MNFYHNLSTTNVLVYLIGKDNDSEPLHIHQKFVGGVHDLGWKGAFWSYLTDDSIRVQRLHSDDAQWTYVRIMIWKIQEP